MQEILSIKNISKSFIVPSGAFSHSELKALNSVSLEVPEGSTVGIVGESGCGKSTLSKVILGIEKPESGEILWRGNNLLKMTRKERAKKVGIIFQDPYSSFNPRKNLLSILSEPLQIEGGFSKEEIRERIFQVINDVGLKTEHLDRYPHMFSGGQRQRIAIARAMINQPELLICDEPVSALDISIQGQILNLLIEIQKKTRLTLLFISHDLSVVRFISNSVAVMYLGKIVEYGDTKSVLESPKHPYSKLLLDSTLTVSKNPKKPSFEAKELPSPLNLPIGCSFQSRCDYVGPQCLNKVPDLVDYNHHKVACFESTK